MKKNEKSSIENTPFLSVLFGVLSGLLIGILLVAISKPVITVVGYVTIDICINGFSDKLMNNYSAYGGNPVVPILSLLFSGIFAILLLIIFIVVYVFAGSWTTKVMQKIMLSFGSGNTAIYRLLTSIIPLAAFVFTFCFIKLDLTALWATIQHSDWVKYFVKGDYIFYYIPKILAPLCFFIGISKQGD